jgi:hypothetical protein
MGSFLCALMAAVVQDQLTCKIGLMAVFMQLEPCSWSLQPSQPEATCALVFAGTMAGSSTARVAAPASLRWATLIIACSCSKSSAQRSRLAHVKLVVSRLQAHGCAETQVWPARPYSA